MKNKIVQLIITIILFNLPSVTNAQSITWMKSFGGIRYENLYDATIDQNGNLYLCGSFMDTIDMAPGEDEYLLVTNISHLENHFKYT